MELLADINHRVRSAGLKAGLPSSNPNVQYGAAKFHQTTYAEDRIYGIMQIYNTLEGQSIRSDDRPILDHLVEEFGLAIDIECPVSSDRAAFFFTGTKPDLACTCELVYHRAVSRARLDVIWTHCSQRLRAKSRKIALGLS